MSKKLTLVVGSLEKGQRIYRAGLKHRILTLPADPDVGIGDSVVVDLTLQFSGDRFELPARAKHCSPASTIVQLESIPSGLYEALGVTAESAAPPAPTPAPTPAAPATGTAPPSGRKFRLSGPRSTGGAAPPKSAPPPAAHAARVGGAARAVKVGIMAPGSSGRVIAAELVEEGSLEDTGMQSILMKLLDRAATGVLFVEGYRERYWCFLVDGQPRKFIRDPASRSDTIDYQASRAKLIPAEELTWARNVAEVTSEDVKEVLVDLELLTDDQVRDLEARAAQQVTHRLLGVNFGTYQVFDYPDLGQALHGKPVDVMAVLWERAREKHESLTEKKIKRLIDQFHKHHIVITEKGKGLVEQLQLGLREQYFMRRYLRGGWQLAELLGRVDIINRSVMEILLTLQDLEIIALSEREGPNWRLARAERFLIDRMDYMGKDHFAFVDAHWSALEGELRKACDKVAHTIEDTIMNQLELEDVRGMRIQIREKLAEVREIFADEQQRRAYRATLVERGKLGMASSLFAKKGEMALFKREAMLAKECFARVVEIDPGGPGSDHKGRARRVLADLSRGVVTQAMARAKDAEDLELLSLEDIDKQ